MSELGTTRKVIVAVAAVNIALSLVAVVVEGPVPSAVVYPAVLAIGILRVARRERLGAAYFLVAGLVFLLVHVTFVREALSSSCVHPFDSARACHESLWLLWLGLAPLALAVTAAVAWIGDRRRTQTGVSAPPLERRGQDA